MAVYVFCLDPIVLSPLFVKLKGVLLQGCSHVQANFPEFIWEKGLKPRLELYVVKCYSASSLCTGAQSEDRGSSVWLPTSISRVLERCWLVGDARCCQCLVSFYTWKQMFEANSSGSSRIDFFPLGPCVTGTHKCLFVCRLLFFKAYF